MSLKLFLAVCLLGAGELYAQSNHMLLIGGGGEPVGKTTIFDKEVSNVGDYLKASGKWSVGTSFNGGHEDTEKIVAAKISATNPSFSANQYETMIADYVSKIRNGTIKPGDQLLVQVSSHGAMNSSGEKSHRVSTAGSVATDLQNLAGSGVVSLDKLQDLINIAASKNVKLALVDLSCHSGNTLALANPNTCIISSSGPVHFGWSGEIGFSNKFTAAMKPGKNLEEVFLEALGKKEDPGFPMISSPVGQDLQREMYKPVTPFLYEWRAKSDHDKLSPYLEQEVLENQCREIPELQEILNFSREADRIVSASQKQNFDAFRAAINEYYQFQLKLRTDLNGMNLPILKQEHKICNDAVTTFANGSKATQSICDTKTTAEIFMMDPAKIRPPLEQQVASGSTPTVVAVAKANLRNIESFMAKKQELIAQNVDFDKYKNYYSSVEGLADRSRGLATKVAKEAAKLYNSVYAERSKTDTRPNPCKSFTL